MVLKKLFAGQQWRNREEIYGHGKRGGEGEMYEESNMETTCPSVDEWIRKLWYIYTMEYYSALKRNASESALMRWMKLEPIRVK